MLRAAAWTCGLFVVAGCVAHFFPGQFTEPLVLMVLGATLFLVSGRSRPRHRTPDAGADHPDAVAPVSRATR
jgi:hypothetical protein